MNDKYILAVVAVVSIVGIFLTSSNPTGHVTSFVVVQTGMDSRWLSDDSLQVLVETGAVVNKGFVIVPDNMILLEKKGLDDKSLKEFEQMSIAYKNQLAIAGEPVVLFGSIKSQFN